MNRESKMMKNTIIYFLGTFGSKALVFILLPLYTYYLSNEEYGHFDLIITTISFLIPIITLQVSEGAYRYLVECDIKIKQKEIIGNSLAITTKSIFIFNLIYFFITKLNLLNIKYNVLICLMINTNVIYTLIIQIIRGLKKNKLYAINGVMTTSITLILNIVFLKYLRMGLRGLLIAQIMGYVFVIAYSIIILSKEEYLLSVNKNVLLRQNLYEYSFPLILNSISWWFMNMSDRYIIKVFLSESANGIYAISTKLPLIVTMINQIFYLSWQESAINEYNSEDVSKFYTGVFKQYYSILLTSIIILLSISNILFEVLIGESFKEAYNYIPLLYLGSVFYAFSSFYGVIYDSSKNTRLSSISSCLGASINVIINILFIKKYGIQVASFSTMLSFLIMWIFRIITTRKYVKIDIDYKRFIILMSFVCVYVKLYYINNIVIMALRVIIGIIIFLYFNIEFIKSIIKTLGIKKSKSIY